MDDEDIDDYLIDLALISFYLGSTTTKTTTKTTTTNKIAMACLDSIASYNLLDGHSMEDKDMEEVDIQSNLLS